jgi:hypothetical protein
MADCLNCKNCIRREIYDGQWGMFKFDRECSAKVSVIVNGKLNPWNMSCDKFEYGEPIIICMTNEEKQKYDTYYSPQLKNEDSKEVDNILLEDNLNNIEEKFKTLGIKIKKWNGKYKSWYQIFKELSKKWNKLK